MVSNGVAKECARFVLPLATPTRMYMNGTIRSWIHYINLRTANGTQKEHMDVANKCKDIFIKQLPVVAEALEWND
jgi:thymidylate synthase (FAD)